MKKKCKKKTKKTKTEKNKVDSYTEKVRPK